MSERDRKLIERLTSRIQSATRIIEDSRQVHLYCDDTWYCCAAHPAYSGLEWEGICDCGADEWNARIDEFLAGEVTCETD